MERRIINQLKGKKEMESLSGLEMMKAIRLGMEKNAKEMKEMLKSLEEEVMLVEKVWNDEGLSEVLKWDEEEEEEMWGKEFSKLEVEWEMNMKEKVKEMRREMEVLLSKEEEELLRVLCKEMSEDVKRLERKGMKREREEEGKEEKEMKKKV